MALIRSKTTLPVAVGFGIKDADSARAVATVADAVVVGSALIDAMVSVGKQQPAASEGQLHAAAAALLKSIREGMDSSPS